VLSGLFEHAVTGDGNDYLIGNGVANRLHGMRGDDTLVGGDGADTLAGGAGNDLYYMDAADTVSEVAGQGWDTVITWFTLTLSDNIEGVFIAGTLAAGATGNNGANYIAGNGADNVLNGAGGADTMIGGLGNDIYIAEASDTITEAAGEGWDSVYAWTNFVLGANLESLFLIGTTGLWGAGNDLVNILTGSSGNDTLSGGGGADTLLGAAGNDLYAIDPGDTVTERAGEGWDSVMSWANYTLGAHLEGLFLMEGTAVSATGNDAQNYIAGNSGDNVLNGAGGADTLVGGLGNDAYITDGLDTITEAEGQGWDTVYAWTNFTLGANLESLFLGGTGALTGVGNALANALTGNAGDNILNGLGGADTLVGGAGNDLYVADTTDTLVEAAGQGWDSVFTLVSYTLGENLEGLFLGGTDAIAGTGNGLANYILGNSGDNTLSGAGGTDVMLGGLGNDLYITDSIDTITENVGEGWDSVVAFTNYVLGANLEGLFLAGTGAVNGWGNAQANYISGNEGSNVLAGLGGNDTLVGGAGADSFVFLGGGEGDRDLIADFDVPLDSILLDDSFFAGLTVGALADGAFGRNLTGEAADADDRIIYETDTGHLYFDRDGTGAAARIHFGSVGANLGLTAADFFVL
jgi:Ca2+-binding RTX toxin-like protein